MSIAVSPWILGGLLLMAPAEPDVAAAAEAFAMGQRAELARDHARAAEFYELADSLAPSPQALRSAAKNWLLADEPALAATRATSLTRRYPDDEENAELVGEILGKTEPMLTRLSVTCDRPCVLSADNSALTVERALSHDVFVTPGAHTLVASFGKGQRVQEIVEGRAGESMDVAFEVPAAPPPEVDEGTATPIDTSDAPVEERKLARLSPAYFAVGAVVTAALGGVTLWSGLNVLSQNDDYKADPTRERYETGRRAETRTNVLIASTAIAGAATVVLGVFTDWKRGRSNRRARSSATPRFVLTPGPASVRVRF